MVNALDRYAFQVITPSSGGMAKTGASTPVNTSRGVQFASAKHVTHGKTNAEPTAVKIRQVDKATGQTVRTVAGTAVASPNKDLSIIKPAQGLGIEGLNVAANDEIGQGSKISNKATGFGGGHLNQQSKGGSIARASDKTFTINSPAGDKKFIPGDSGSGAVTNDGKLAGVVSKGEVDPVSQQQVTFARITQSDVDSLAALSNNLPAQGANYRMSQAMLGEAANDKNYALAA